ncbi:helicase-exonuclease AddAB subunit AddB [Paenibacillus periandrae]|uniref:helicase-exonuclease AddAB subunit AddB n=1 Tax=Paenibacillus periandrae TaxID=1761741 RepID=UPI001F091384|nr:helicase-exonuclease AddAB subunit AddB [Paenibacillus periandrae]
MAITFIIGRSGSGKSNYCLNEIKERLLLKQSGNPIILLVPEQATFQAEHDLVTSPGLGGLMRAQVLSFRRLAWKVMQETGGTASGVMIDDSGKKMLIQHILQKRKEQLRLFKGYTEKMGFIETIGSFFNELGRYRLTAESLDSDFQRAREKIANVSATLSLKMEDLLLIYRDYEMILSNGFMDSESYLNRLAAQLPETTLAGKAELWIDGFFGFTAQELEVVIQAITVFPNVTITFCSDRVYGGDEFIDELSLFYPTAKTMKRIQTRLKEIGLLPEVIQLEGGIRFKEAPMLDHLERHYENRLFEGVPEFANNTEEIKIFAAVNRRAEIEAAGREMIRLARERGFRYRDMAIRVRNLEDYGELIKTIFGEMNIPFFLDQKRNVIHHPLVEFIRSSIDVVVQKWRFDAMFRCIKTDFLLPLDNGNKKSRRLNRHDTDELENLVLAYGLHGSRWTDKKNWEFRQYRSLEDENSVDTDESFNKRMDRCRRMIAKPLRSLEKDLNESQTIRERVIALYKYLVEVKAPERILHWSDECLVAGQPEKAKEHAQIWENVISMLEQMVDVIGNDKVSLDIFSTLVQTGLESIQQGLVPPSLDQVLVGSIDRTRSAQMKVAFVLGCNDGILPKSFDEAGVITEEEREWLIENGIEIADSVTRKLLDEQFLIYTVLCGPSHKLWLSYPLSDEEGKSLLPSEILTHVRRLFPDIKEELIGQMPDVQMPHEEQLAFVSNPEKTLTHLVTMLKEWTRGMTIAPGWFAVYNWLLNNGYGDRIQKVFAAIDYRNQESLLRPEVGELLYGDLLKTSVSRMEKYVGCPFSHFAASGLKLEERKIYKLNNPDIGRLYHAALTGLMKELQREDKLDVIITDEELYHRVSTIVDILSPRLQGDILSSTFRYRHIAKKLKEVVSKTAKVLLEHNLQSEFVPVGLELAFGPGETLPSLIIPLDKGKTLEVVGRIDRVDQANLSNGTFLRIIDYKSSKTSLDLSNVYHGTSLQLLTYLDVVLSHSKVWLGQQGNAAGALYMHVHNPLLNLTNPIDAEQVEKEILKQFKMKGLLLADNEMLGKMDNTLAGGESDFLPVSFKKDGTFYKNASVASKEQFERLQNHVRKVITDVGNGIIDGHVEIQPTLNGKKLPCQFCSYQPVCHFDSLVNQDDVRVLPSLDDEEVWRRLEKDDESNEEV